MNLVVGGVLLVVIFLVLATFVKNGGKENKKNTKGNGEITGKRMMSANEINLYEKLTSYLPNYIIFSQVSFSAFLNSKDYATRATFNRKFADFVILDRNYEIVCLVELDDSSHRNKEYKDKQRDALCMKGGYQVIRFSSQPNMGQIQNKLGFLVQPAPQMVNGI
jgi:very-short-patch-repair endonuclease